MSGFNQSLPETSLASLFDQVRKPVSAEIVEAKTDDQPKKRPPPVSIRLSEDELAQVRVDAAGMSLSGYIRERLFKDPTPRKTRGKFPVKDHQALAKVLAALGRANLTSGFGRIIRQVEDGHLNLDPALEQDIRQVCADVAAIRSDLIRALGLSPK